MGGFEAVEGDLAVKERLGIPVALFHKDAAGIIGTAADHFLATRVKAEVAIEEDFRKAFD